MHAGVGFLVVAMLLTPALDGAAKVLATENTPMTIAFLRYFTAGTIVITLARLTGRQIEVPRDDRRGMVFRTALMMGAMTMLITALSMVPMAKAVGGFLIAPIVSGLLCVFLYGESLSPSRVAGTAVSFMGAYMMLRPEAGLDAGSLFALGGGTLLGAYLAATRGARQSDPFSTLAVQCMLGAALIAPFALAGGLPRLSPELVIGTLVLGAVSAVCHFLTVAAYARTEATVLAPFMYFNLIAAMVVGFFFFDESLSREAMVGLSAIAAGGMVTLLRCNVRIALPLRPGRGAGADGDGGWVTLS
jgi:drug/metabolite transporter (DMT)-like permease